jgi:hypothetical protein
MELLSHYLGQLLEATFRNDKDMLYATEEKDELDYPCCQVWDHADKVLRAIRVDQQYIQSFYYRFDPASF